MLYRAINGESEGAPAPLERREDPGPRPAPHRYEGPPTPCPARVEYATPVFARNYQGVWRYVEYPQKRADEEKPPHCDGHDNFGCFQVQLLL
ncbi:unnamed protein product [Chilo suppressalis]|uniref:Spaetzle domain-containing protein n=1 Tax=Chilo suppressalis TaxID=168631 RepID=A0ABN8BAX4_CHISP|nr:unnamed protein product [Chilo suppressalis]